MLPRRVIRGGAGVNVDVATTLNRLEFTPLALHPVATIRAEIDPDRGNVIVSLDGEVLFEARIAWQHPGEGELDGARHYVEITPHRTDAEWDEGPVMLLLPTSDPMRHQ